jgi:hypothetical protein
MKFVIYTPNWDETSGGINVLTVLAQKLHEKGHDVHLWTEIVYFNSTYNPVFSRFTNQVGFDDETIVIYPEIVTKNPLQAKRIVRWILYGCDNHDEYEPNGAIYYFAPFCQNNFPTKMLQCYHVPPNLSVPTEPRTEESCFIFKKGQRSPWARKQFNINPHKGFDLSVCKTHAEIIEVFKKTKYFHCYDPASFLILMALMCGCIVIQHPYIEGQKREGWEHSVCFDKFGKVKGLVYGDEYYSYAESTIHEAHEYCQKILNSVDSTIDSFIQDMETGNYTDEPCYKFNNSPYSYQHVYR